MSKIFENRAIDTIYNNGITRIIFIYGKYEISIPLPFKSLLTAQDVNDFLVERKIIPEQNPNELSRCPETYLKLEHQFSSDYKGIANYAHKYESRQLALKKAKAIDAALSPEPNLPEQNKTPESKLGQGENDENRKNVKNFKK